jgi:hypothetical protein
MFSLKSSKDEIKNSFKIDLINLINNSLKEMVLDSTHRRLLYIGDGFNSVEFDDLDSEAHLDNTLLFEEEKALMDSKKSYDLSALNVQPNKESFSYNFEVIRRVYDSSNESYRTSFFKVPINEVFEEFDSMTCKDLELLRNIYTKNLFLSK